MLGIPPGPARLQRAALSSLIFETGNILTLKILLQCLKYTGICVAGSVLLKAVNREKFM